MMRADLIRLVACMALGSIGMSAFAAPVSIASYDITGYQYQQNLYGYYDGKVEQTGDKSYSYSGGSGTLNDGYITEKYTPVYKSTYLFYFDQTPTITLHLSEMASVSSIDFFSFTDNNLYAGSIGGLNITINGETRFIGTDGFGEGNKWREHTNNRLNLAGSGLEDLMTDTIVLSGFVPDQGTVTDGNNVFSVIGFYLSEITVEGAPYSAGGTVPEPAGLALLATGIAGLGMIRRRQRK